MPVSYLMVLYFMMLFPWFANLSDERSLLMMVSAPLLGILAMMAIHVRSEWSDVGYVLLHTLRAIGILLVALIVELAIDQAERTGGDLATLVVVTSPLWITAMYLLYRWQRHGTDAAVRSVMNVGSALGAIGVLFTIFVFLAFPLS